MPTHRTALIVLIAIQVIILATALFAMAAGSPLKPMAFTQLLGFLSVLTGAYLVYFVSVERRTSQNGADWSSHLRYSVNTQDNTSNQLSDTEQLQHFKERVSHELRTPLNAMIGFSEIMHREILGPVGNERYREYAGHIARSAERFQIATERTLAATELLVSPPSGKRSVFDLGDLARDVVHERGTASGHLKIELLRDPNGPGSANLAEGNRAALKDALHHLIGAAEARARATQGLVDCHISLDAESSTHAGLHVELIEKQDEVFCAAGSEDAAGAELGLLLAQLGVEAAGGVLLLNTDHIGSWRADVRLTVPLQHELNLL